LFLVLFKLEWLSLPTAFPQLLQPRDKVALSAKGVFLTNLFFLPFFSFLFLLSNQRDLRTLKSVAYYVADTIDSRFNLQLEGKRES